MRRPVRAFERRRYLLVRGPSGTQIDFGAAVKRARFAFHTDVEGWRHENRGYASRVSSSGVVAFTPPRAHGSLSTNFRTESVTDGRPRHRAPAIASLGSERVDRLRARRLRRTRRECPRGRRAKLGLPSSSDR